ncbi:helix-turn-helix transcriptional regulator [Phytomonospora sp. NPDC050363]|uniref:helix-turn-helix domain-containing protein n=1 Tax=Phytomonospora sp. NPDC050363 TaxID=3155642 RepID=UPI0033ED034B
MGENTGITTEELKTVQKRTRKKAAAPRASAPPTAAGEETFGIRLRRLRTEAGLSIAEFALRTNYSKGYISKIETGAKPPNGDLARCCDEALNASGTLLALMPEEAEGPARAVAEVAAEMSATAVEDVPPPPSEEQAPVAAEVEKAPVAEAPVAEAPVAEIPVAEIPAQAARPGWPAEPPSVLAEEKPPETPEPGAPTPPPLTFTGPNGTRAEATTDPFAPYAALRAEDAAAGEVAAPAETAPAVAEAPKPKRVLMLVGLALLLVAAVVGAVLLVAAVDDPAPTQGRVLGSLTAQRSPV